MDKRKIAAAMAGVMEFMKARDAALVEEAPEAAAEASTSAPAPLPPPSAYALSGRMAAMQWRNMFQMRAVRGLR